MPKENNLEGLGGWLIIVGLVLILSPIRILIQVFPVYSEIFASGTWAILTTPGTDNYNSLWAPILVGEILMNGGLIVEWLILSFLFFSKKKLFPRCFIGMWVCAVALLILNVLSYQAISPNEPLFNAESAKELKGSLIGATVWISYTLKSKRVKATFVS